MDLPEKIKRMLPGQEYTLDQVGMSGASVLLFPDRVLKIQKIGWEPEQEYCMMQWLWGKLPVPRILAYEREAGYSFLLMERCPGEMSCSEENLGNPDRLVPLLAEALKQLWAVDISDCPVDCTLRYKLERARFQVEHSLVDMDNTEPGTFGEGGFESPRHLLSWLYEHQPVQEKVLSHGDFCLPNIFLDRGKVSGYIDLGRAGVADKWQDIALCYRSLHHNLSGAYHYKLPVDYDADQLFDLLGVEPDRDKLRYYILLDELF